MTFLTFFSYVIGSIILLHVSMFGLCMILAGAGFLANWLFKKKVDNA